VII
jgi:MFS family permease